MKLTAEQKQANKVARQEAKTKAKELARIESERNQKPVKTITISIEWKKSRMWGYNPTCEAKIEFKDGSFERSETFTASGCGYDKESTVIASVFNAYLKYKLWNLGITVPDKGGNGSLSNNNTPYGIHCYTDNRPHFGGGIGTNCYYDIAKFIGGVFEHTANGNSFDVYTYRNETDIINA